MKKLWWIMLGLVGIRSKESTENEVPKPPLSDMQQTVLRCYGSSRESDVRTGVSFAQIHSITLPTELLKEMIRAHFRVGNLCSARCLCEAYNLTPAKYLRELSARYPQGVRWDRYDLSCCLRYIRAYEEESEENKKLADL